VREETEGGAGRQTDKPTKKRERERNREREREREREPTGSLAG
jgi:hypothetical protein